MTSVSRRRLLAGLSLLPMAGRAFGSPFNVRRHRHATGGGSMPSISPGAGWTGTAKSGGVPAVFPSGVTTSNPITRTTAKPAIHWLVPSDLRLVGSRVYGVDADAKGGLSGVVFHCEGNEVTVAAPSFYSDTDANGASRTRYGYWINVVTAATSGEARLFATAVPIDGTMQNRVIGYDTVSGLDGNYPMSLFPRAAANDWSKTVRLDGTGDYITLQAAIDAAAVAVAGGAEAPLITITQTGSYEATNTTRSIGAGWPVAKSYATITHGSGVVATIGRAAAFDPNTSASWAWTPGLDGMEFRGAGIVFDQRNWTTILFTAKPAWMNGCKFTNSIGTLFTYYWNGGAHPGFGSSVAGYWDDAHIEFVCLEAAVGHQRYTRGCAIHEYASDIFTGTHYVANNYVRHWDVDMFATPVAALQISYTPPSGQTSATVTKTGHDGAASTLTLAVNGATTHTITLGQTPSGGNFLISDVVATINGFGDGWSATSPARSGMRATALGGENGGLNPNAANAFNTTVSISAAFGIHADWWQGFSAASTRENVHICNNVCRADNVADNDAWLFNDDDGNSGHSFDHIVKNNIWVGSTTKGAPNNDFGGNRTSHYVFENNTMQSNVDRREYVNGDPAQGADVGETTYSSYRNNLIETPRPFGWTGSGTYFPNSPPWINNGYIQSLINGSNVITMNGPSDTGNFNYNGSATFTTLFVDYANGDFRPAASGPVLANLKSKVNTYDGSGVAYSASDVVGARSLNASAPSYPF